MEGRTKMELFDTIRREYAQGATIQGLANKHGVHRRMVRQALKSAMPLDRKKVEREKPKLEPVMGMIDGILIADQQAPGKQRHTAHRIFERLVVEKPEHVVAEATVRR